MVTIGQDGFVPPKRPGVVGVATNSDPRPTPPNRTRTVPRYRTAAILLVLVAFPARASHFSTQDQTAAKFGVHEIVLTGAGPVANAFDTVATVKFVPASGEKNARTVYAFYDGDATWRARVYVGEAGEWTWVSACATDKGLDGKRGSFAAEDSKLRGRLLPHPKNPRHWITEDGRWFLHVNDTAYFLLCTHDGNGDPVTDEDAQRYVRDAAARGITAVRCFLAGSERGFGELQEQWSNWIFADGANSRLRLDNLRCADRRLRALLDRHPDVAVQLILFPLTRYARDETFWAALTAGQKERVLRHLVARFGAYPQLLWLIVNDAHYGPKFPNNNALAREAGAYLAQHDVWQHPRSTGHARRVPFYFGDDDWATYVHLEHEHDLGAAEYARYHRFAKPVFLGEDRYEQDHGPKTDPANMSYWQRRLFWAWLLSGGSANYGGRWWVVHPYSETGKRDTSFHKRKDVVFRARLSGLDSVKHIRDYFDGRKIDLGEFEPDHALVEDPAGVTEPRTPKLMRRGREEFLVYHPNAGADGKEAKPDASRGVRLRLDLRLVGGTFLVEWYRAEDGASRDGGTVEGGQWSELVSPWIGHDIVCRLIRKPKAER
jgi:hypothetical protein